MCLACLKIIKRAIFKNKFRINLVNYNNFNNHVDYNLLSDNVMTLTLTLINDKT